jgi:hypothetical protein
LKGACPVREEVAGNVPQGNALAAYFIRLILTPILGKALSEWLYKAEILSISPI